uniref:Uncharacterized protein n=1 Tax=Romanomermis culicivorax TaxID=13658 RepID=A0A915JPE9_ROMCU
MLDVYVNIMQAAESAKSSSTNVHGDLKDVHAIGNNSHHDSDRYINRGRDQSPNPSKHSQSPTRSKPCLGCSSTHHTYLLPNRKERTANVTIVVIWDILQSIGSDVKRTVYPDN